LAQVISSRYTLPSRPSRPLPVRVLRQMKMARGFVASLLVASCAAASLRASPQATAKVTPTVADEVAKTVAKAMVGKANTPADKQLAQSVAEKVAATVAKAMNVETKVAKAKVAGGAAAKKVVHKKVDMGFQDFEKNLTEEVSARLLKTATGTAWTDDSRSKFNKNVTEALHKSLQEILKPVKMSIGKTWMALPRDEQKDEYVSTLKSAFLEVFENSMKTIVSHLELSIKRVADFSKDKTLKATEVLEKSEVSVADSLITEHCYEVSAKKSMKSIKKPANKTEVLADKKKFCINSVIGALAHRLNDTQGLISMSMRFDAGAMSLAQKKKQAALLQEEVSKPLE